MPAKKTRTPRGDASGSELVQRLLQQWRAQGIFPAGTRVGVAVSGGADSVALLRILLALRQEMGLVLSVVHYEHGIRGGDSVADANFVRELAAQFDLEVHFASGDARAYGAARKISLETAARECRYEFFAKLLDEQKNELIATAHTMDDQAETVLMRLLRGAGTRGMAGIHPRLELGAPGKNGCVRPLLEARHAELVAYLKSLGQAWREDASNADVRHERNKIRHGLLPLLEKEHNPNIVETLAAHAAVARDEEKFWQQEVARALPLVLRPGRPVRGGGRAAGLSGNKCASLELSALLQKPAALQRRLIRAAAESLGIELDSAHVESALGVAHSQHRECFLPGGWRMRRNMRELEFVSPEEAKPKPYSYEVGVPGEVLLAELGIRLKTSLPEGSSYNPAGFRLTLRSWRAGDRFWPAGHGSAKKVKELLQVLHLELQERAQWPVLVQGEDVLWLRGFEPHPALPVRLQVEESPAP